MQGENLGGNLVSYKDVSEFMYENFESVSQKKSGMEFNARCALCGDSKKSKSKKRFWLNYNNGSPIYHCFNCGASGNYISLYATIKCLSHEDAKKEIYKFNSDTIQNRLNGKKYQRKGNETTKNTNHNYILNDCISLSSDVSGIILCSAKKTLENFVKSRLIPEDVKVFIAYKGKFRGRIIIPIYDEMGNIVYFQARSLAKNPVSKYKNPPLPKNEIILNQQKFDRNKYIIVTEGLLDAFSIGNQGTTCLGKDISDDFLEKLLSLTDVGVIIALDNDDSGISSLKELINKPITKSRKIKFFLFPPHLKFYNDINNYVTSKNITNTEEVYDFVISNSFRYYKAKVKLLAHVKK